MFCSTFWFLLLVTLGGHCRCFSQVCELVAIPPEALLRFRPGEGWCSSTEGLEGVRSADSVSTRPVTANRGHELQGLAAQLAEV